MSQQRPVRTYNRIMSHLYVGGFVAAQDLSLLQTHLNISRMIVIREKDLDTKSPTIEYSYYKYRDDASENLHERFDEIADIIETERVANHRVFVACQQGMSRSISIILAYLIKYTDQNLRQAYEYVRYVRPCIAINPHFVMRLIAFERKHRYCQSVGLYWKNGTELWPNLEGLGTN